MDLMPHPAMRRETSWQISPFTQRGEVLAPHREAQFSCPVLGTSVAWAAKDVFNPGAVVRDGRVYLLVRGEDMDGPHHGTSRIGLAVSADGVTFTLAPEPVLHPDRDAWQPWEWPGGCEDPRVVEAPEGGYVCLYSAFDGKSSCLCVASSGDLVHWDKHGPAFAGSPYARRWSKSGAIVTAVQDGRLIAARLNGRFHMYWGEGTCFGATSDDLVHWSPNEFDAGADRYLTHSAGGASGPWQVHRVPGHRELRPLLVPRPGRFDSLLVEPGPPAIVTDRGIVLIYNGAELVLNEKGEPNGVAYQPGQVLFDPNEPGSPIGRAGIPFLPGEERERLSGQVDNVCFAQGLVLFEGSWFLYYGMADSRIGCATAADVTTRNSNL
jgi:predicted GH43/DUF377 family glycosyl hydrolase